MRGKRDNSKNSFEKLRSVYNQEQKAKMQKKTF